MHWYYDHCRSNSACKGFYLLFQFDFQLITHLSSLPSPFRPIKETTWSRLNRKSNLNGKIIGLLRLIHLRRNFSLCLLKSYMKSTQNIYLLSLTHTWMVVYIWVTLFLSQKLNLLLVGNVWKVKEPSSHLVSIVLVCQSRLAVLFNISYRF